jgi:CheY-like chemotaxis protein
MAADRGRFEQLVVNLVVNARDALPDGGRVRITTSLDDDTDCVRLEVADNGTGMSPEVCARAFDPFFTTKGAGRGTGLGLATVQSIVTDLGGTIAIDSTLGVGTRVIVCLPTADGAPPLAASAPTFGGHGERVLLAEDHNDVRTSLAETLRRAGYEVVAVSSGEAAFDAWDATEFDLLITDIVMRGISGRRLAERLRAASPGLPVIYLSGYTHHLVDATEDAQGTAVTIAKPVARAQLLRHVRALLDTSPASGGTRIRAALHRSH